VQLKFISLVCTGPGESAQVLYGGAPVQEELRYSHGEYRWLTVVSAEAWKVLNSFLNRWLLSQPGFSKGAV